MLHDISYVRITGTIFLVVIFLGYMIPVSSKYVLSAAYDRWLFQAAFASLFAFLVALVWS